jgi:hypothetical protein
MWVCRSHHSLPRAPPLLLLHRLLLVRPLLLLLLLLLLLPKTRREVTQHQQHRLHNQNLTCTRLRAELRRRVLVMGSAALPPHALRLRARPRQLALQPCSSSSNAMPPRCSGRRHCIQQQRRQTAAPAAARRTRRWWSVLLVAVLSRSDRRAAQTLTTCRQRQSMQCGWTLARVQAPVANWLTTLTVLALQWITRHETLTVRAMQLTRRRETLTVRALQLTRRQEGHPPLDLLSCLLGRH